MWQRIQTLYLFISGVTSTLLLLVTLFTVNPSGQEVLYTANFTGLIVSGWTSIKYFNLVTFVLTSLVTILSFATIFLYKWRKLQIRLTIIGLLLMVAAIVAFAYMLWQQADLLKRLLRCRAGSYCLSSVYCAYIWLCATSSRTTSSYVPPIDYARTDFRRR